MWGLLCADLVRGEGPECLSLPECVVSIMCNVQVKKLYPQTAFPPG